MCGQWTRVLLVERNIPTGARLQRAESSAQSRARFVKDCARPGSFDWDHTQNVMLPGKLFIQPCLCSCALGRESPRAACSGFISEAQREKTDVAPSEQASTHNLTKRVWLELALRTGKTVSHAALFSSTGCHEFDWCAQLGCLEQAAHPLRWAVQKTWPSCLNQHSLHIICRVFRSPLCLSFSPGIIGAVHPSVCSSVWESVVVCQEVKNTEINW